MSAVSTGIGNAMGTGGKSMGGDTNYQPTQATQGNPNVGIGFGPAPIEQNPMDTFGGGLASVFNGMPTGAQPQPMPTSGMGGGKGLGQDLGSILGSVGGLGSQMLTQINPGLAPIGNVVNTAGQGAGAILNGALNGIQGNVFGGGNSIYQPNFMPQGPQIGFGPAPIEQNPMQPAPQPVNRFAPPNAPGVRQQPRTAPRAGIPVQSARMVQPNRNTRTRLR